MMNTTHHTRRARTAVQPPHPRSKGHIQPQRSQTAGVFRRSTASCTDLKVNDVAEDGLTPLIRAVISEDRESGRALLSGGADPNIPGNGLMYPLHHAARTGDVTMMQLLLAANSCINCIDKNNWTPLHLSIVCDHVECVRLLLQLGADYAARNSKGETAFDLAQSMTTRNALSKAAKTTVDCSSRFLHSVTFEARNDHMHDLRELGLQIYIPPRALLTPVMVSCSRKQPEFFRSLELEKDERLNSNVYEIYPKDIVFYRDVTIGVELFEKNDSKYENTVLKMDNEEIAKSLRSIKVKGGGNTKVFKVSKLSSFHVVKQQAYDIWQAPFVLGARLTSSIESDVSLAIPKKAMSSQGVLRLRVHPVCNSHLSLVKEICSAIVSATPFIEIGQKGCEPPQRYFSFILPLPEGVVNRKLPTGAELHALTFDDTCGKWVSETGFQIMNGKIVVKTRTCSWKVAVLSREAERESVLGMVRHLHNCVLQSRQKTVLRTWAKQTSFAIEYNICIGVEALSSNEINSWQKSGYHLLGQTLENETDEGEHFTIRLTGNLKTRDGLNEIPLLFYSGRTNEAKLEFKVATKSDEALVGDVIVTRSSPGVIKRDLLTIPVVVDSAKLSPCWSSEN